MFYEDRKKVLALLEEFVEYAAEASGMHSAQAGRLLLTVPADRVLKSYSNVKRKKRHSTASNVTTASGAASSGGKSK